MGESSVGCKQDKIICSFPFDNVCPHLGMHGALSRLSKQVAALRNIKHVRSFSVGQNVFLKTYKLQSSLGGSGGRFLLQ